MALQHGFHVSSPSLPIHLPATHLPLPLPPTFHLKNSGLKDKCMIYSTLAGHNRMDDQVSINLHQLIISRNMQRIRTKRLTRIVPMNEIIRVFNSLYPFLLLLSVLSHNSFYEKCQTFHCKSLTDPFQPYIPSLT